MAHDDSTTDRAWAVIESRLDRDPFGADFNTAHEACIRYASDPGRMALTIRHEDGSADRWTYHDLDREAAKAARVFARAGLRPGDRVAGLLSRQVESWITALAAWRSGLVYVPLFGGFGPEPISLRLKAARVAAVVVDAKYRRALQQAQQLGDVDVTVFVTGASVEAGDRSFWSELDAADADGPVVPTKLGDTATVLFTSGTSGTPKACVMTHAAFLSVMPYVVSVLGLGPQSRDVVFSTADPAWAYGLYSTGASVMALGVHRVMYTGPFDPEKWYRVLSEEQATVVTTAPAALRRWTEPLAKGGVPPSLRLVAAAGEPLTEAVASAWAATGAPAVRNGYGLSEVGMLLGDVLDAGTSLHPGKIAGSIPGFEVFLAGRDGTPVGAGEPGLIAVRRPRHQMSAAYENVPERWKTRWRGDVFLTEDLAVRDAGGRWQVLGRDDDIIIASGHNVSPVEVENALLQHPGVAEAAAVAHVDDVYGNVVRAVVVRTDTAPAEGVMVDELKSLVGQHVGRYAAPRVVDFVSELPRTEVGKLRRSALRAEPMSRVSSP
ncbi:AMP-binding protein [Mycolicibacterium goodii]|uniref:AMP-binding protein n=1 Tax=Mycolicibacterium goodii TaxID=134601 RepID=UPI001BDD39AE|nr:AMP-binding protein [Mycolicibacterium goodii]MBU8834330.1 AMP-binding protein [Mycolicibacterium goodii]